MRKNLKTNEDLVRDLMNYSPYGALNQAFIVQAIMTFAEQVARQTPESLDTNMVSGKAWHGCAIDTLARCNEFYQRKR